MSNILGIDLGTTNSAMAYVQGGDPTIIENSEGNRTTPSVVAINKAGERLVGTLAKRQAVVNPANTIFSAKRLIGRTFDDPEVQRDKELLPYEIRKAPNGGVEIKFGEKWLRPAEISAMVLQKLKADAESKLGQTITDAVIVPPTAQNQTAVEADLAGFVQTHLHLDDAALQWQCEQAIRNYDPCISCATHFLDLRVVEA
jgi:molecular chaperone DnaK